MIPTSPFWQDSFLGVAQSNRLFSVPVQVEENMSVSRKQPCWNYCFGRLLVTAIPRLCPMFLQTTSASKPVKFSVQTLYQFPSHFTCRLPLTILIICSGSGPDATFSLAKQTSTTCSSLTLFGSYEHLPLINTWEPPTTATNSVVVYDWTRASPSASTTISCVFWHSLSHYVIFMASLWHLFTNNISTGVLVTYGQLGCSLWHKSLREGPIEPVPHRLAWIYSPSFG